MPVYSSHSFDNHQEIAFWCDPASGLKAIIAVHNLNLGPALGGCRMYPYADEAAALEDVLRLSRGMTYKSALAGLDFGGGKSVIIGDPATDKSPALFESLGRFVNTLGGSYIVAEDVGTGVADMEIVARTTRHVRGTRESGSADPSPATAWGVFNGIKAAVKHRFGRDDLTGLRVAIQGLGHVGIVLAEHLRQAGAELLVSDVDDASVLAAVTRFGATAVPVDAITAAEADIFAPCALGAILDDASIAGMRARIIAGAANNQLAEDHHGEALRRAGILYAPDFVINAGGVINIAHEYPAYDRKAAFDHIAGIYDTLVDLFRRAETEDIATNVMADRMAWERVEAAAHAKEPLRQAG